MSFLEASSLLMMQVQAAPRLIPIAPVGGMPDSLGQITTALGDTQSVWGAALIFVRLGTVIMLLPGLGDQATPPRLRLSLAFMLALLLMPVMGQSLPRVPPGLGDTVYQVTHEFIIGLLLGTLIRVFISTLAVAGEVVSFQTTLSFAQSVNPMQAQSTTSLGTFLALLGLVLVYAMNLHHLFIEAMIDSYRVFPAIKPIMVEDASILLVRTVGQTFVIALQMSAPVIAFGLIFNIAVGFVGRIMPAFPVFFAATPLSVLLGLSIFAISLGVSGLVFIEHYKEFLGIFIRGEVPRG
jgi:flagellar biosynthesis protein FliR